MNRPFLFTIFIALFLCSNAWAQGSLNFHPPKNIKEKRLIEYIQKNSQNTDIEYVLTAVDLNRDVINEYIVKPKSPKDCRHNRLCLYHIIALQERSPITIGKFNAHKITISNKKTYGVRNIIVYNDAYNDYKTKIAVWHPYDFKYR